MKSIFSGIIAAIFLCTMVLAQNATSAAPTSAPTQNSQTPAPTSQPSAQNPQGSAAQNQTAEPSSQAKGGKKIAAGSVIPVELTKTVDAKKAKVGDRVEAKVTQDMKAQNGDIVVAKDTKVLGKVTEAQPRDKQQKESQLAIAFDQMVTKESGDVSVPMSIQAIIAPSTMQSNNSNAAAQGTPQSAPSASAGNTGARAGGMGGGGAATPPAPTPEQVPTNSQTQASSRPQITGNTQGVIGISGLQLSSGQNPAQGSLMTSDKSNVKLENGTMMLLRVNQ